MTNNTGLDDVMRRVKKLLAIAEDARANAEEASAAAGMAERIMRKYQIEHADVIEAELKRGGAESFAEEDVGSTLDPEGWSKESSGWAGILAVAVAKFCDCQARYTRTEKHGKTIRFQGYAADAQMARYTYIYLVQTMAAAGRQYARFGYGRSECTAFRRGFNSALTSALGKATAAKRAEMQQAPTSRDLVIVKGQAVAAHFGDIKYRKSSSRTGRGGAFSEGFARGSQVDVTRRGVGVHSSAGSIA